VSELASEPTTRRAVRVTLPAHLRDLAGVTGELRIPLADGAPVTQRSVLDGLEALHPVLRGTLRDHDGRKRRPFVRFFVGEVDRSHDDPDDPLPPTLADGTEVFHVIGAMAGG
jgi:hypothetical protein